MCLANIPDLTVSVGSPRVVGIEYPFGRVLGNPGDASGQLAVVRAMLEALEAMPDPGGVEHLELRWPESAAKARSHPPVPSPIASHLKRHPWHLPRMFTRDIP
ncbi:MAG: hypothetical protein HKO65_06450 [Gemmatimonadetes bacterium]|nr:hypothetical protein [Gemmatimonadota bacterium]NNM04728.1 hypothetical protein [Gemmatimonadota bacterium]